MKPVRAGTPSAPIAEKMKKMKISQKTARAIPFEGLAPGHHPVDVRVRVGLAQAPVHADLLEHLAHDGGDDLRDDEADEQDDEEAQEVGQEREE